MSQWQGLSHGWSCDARHHARSRGPTEPVASSPLAGRRVLLAEDCVMTGAILRDILVAQGCTVIGPVASVPVATATAAQWPLDAALLDLNLRDGPSIPVALLLAGRGVPLLFLTGAGREKLPAALSHCGVLTKPTRMHTLLAALRDLCACRSPVARSASNDEC